MIGTTDRRVVGVVGAVAEVVNPVPHEARTPEIE
jgi:hypothetical protein